MNLDLVLTVLPVLTFFVLSATLVILVVHARLLRRSLQSAIYNQIVDQNLHLNEVMLRGSLEAKRALLNTQDNEEEIDTALIAASLIDHYENVFIKHRLDNLPDTVWPGWKDYMRLRILTTPVLHNAWRRMKNHMDADFVSYVTTGQ